MDIDHLLPGLLLRRLLSVKLNYKLSMSWYHLVMGRNPYHVRCVRSCLSQTSSRMTKIGCGKMQSRKMIELVYLSYSYALIAKLVSRQVFQDVDIHFI